MIYQIISIGKLVITNVKDGKLKMARILIKNEVINTNFMVKAYVLDHFLHIKHFHQSLGPYTSDGHTTIKFDDEKTAYEYLKKLANVE